MIDPRFPIGKFQYSGPPTQEQEQQFLNDIAQTPADLRASVKGLTDEQLDTPYRPGGWSVRQVVHHLPDSHMNSYVRFRLAVTENTPTIKTYEEALWAQLPDARNSPIEPSLLLLEGLHGRFTALLRSLTEADF